MTVLNVRAREDGDLDACERLAREVHLLDGYPPRLAHDLRRFVEAEGSLGAWVAESHDGIAGHVALLAKGSPPVMAVASEATGLPPERLCVVARLFVAPAHRRKGVGAALLARAASEARGRELRPILDVAAHFDSSIRFYEKSGWLYAARVTVHFLEDEPLDELVYVAPD